MTPKKPKSRREKIAVREKRQITDKNWTDFSASKMKVKLHLQRVERKLTVKLEKAKLSLDSLRIS